MHLRNVGKHAGCRFFEPSNHHRPYHFALLLFSYSRLLSLLLSCSHSCFPFDLFLVSNGRQVSLNSRRFASLNPFSSAPSPHPNQIGTKAMAQEAWNPSSPLESAFLFNGQTRSLFQGINDNAAWYPQHQPQSQQQDRGLVMLFSPEGQVLKINFQNAKEYLGAGFGEPLFGRTGLQVDSLFHYEDLPGILQGFEELDQHHPRVLDVRMVTDFGR